MNKTLWLLSGGNGVGKSTFYNLFLKPKGVAFINADEIAKELFPDDVVKASYQAAKIATKMREDLLLEGRSFCFETVFSHPSKIDFIAKAKILGYCINLIFIHISSAELNIARVSSRVQEGGHNVPEDKIRTRIPRVLKNVSIASQISDSFVVFDNSSIKQPYQKILMIKNGKTTQYVDKLPEWCHCFTQNQ